jgi:hypothetical protein
MAIVSLTFDDGVDADLDAVVPVLDRHGLRGTFFIAVGGDCFTRRSPEWRSVAAGGHELGNHTIFHPMDSTHAGVTDGIALERYSMDRMRRELVAASAILRMLDGRTERTFAFPCNNPWVGRRGIPRRLLRRLGLDRTRLAGWVDRFDLDLFSEIEDYTCVVRGLFTAARLGTSTVEGLPRVPEDRYRIRAVEPLGASGRDLEAIVDAAVERDCWLTFVFHAVGGTEALSCPREAFETLAGRLADDRRVSVVSFVEGAKQCLGSA